MSGPAARGTLGPRLTHLSRRHNEHAPVRYSDGGSGPAAVPHPAASNLELISQALPVMDLPTIWAAKRELESQVEPVSPDPHIEEFLHRRFLANDPVCLLRMAEQLLTETDRVDDFNLLMVPVGVGPGPRLVPDRGPEIALDLV